MNIAGVGTGLGIGGELNGSGAAKPTSVAGDTGKFFNELISKVNDLQNQSDKAVQSLASGETKNLHEVMISMEKASVSFQFLNQVRNKALEAYQEVMRMQV